MQSISINIPGNVAPVVVLAGYGVERNSLQTEL